MCISLNADWPESMDMAVRTKQGWAQHQKDDPAWRDHLHFLEARAGSYLARLQEVHIV